MNIQLTSKVFILALLSGMLLHFSAFSQNCFSNDPSAPAGIVPVTYPGNTPHDCFKIDPPVSGTYNLDAFGNTVTITVSTVTCLNQNGNPATSPVFTWVVSGNIVIDQVLVKGGDAYNLYDYTGLTPRPQSDGYLHAPVNASATYAGLSHINFCYHYRLAVSKTASTTYTRDYAWCIDKECRGPNPLGPLSVGQIYNYPFRWTASACDYTDSDWLVSGEITIENHTPLEASVTGVTDVLSDGTVVSVDCGSSFPFALLSGGTRNCTYTVALSGPNGGTNTVTVTTGTAEVEGNTAHANYSFGDPTTVLDACITVTDDCTGTTEVCLGDAPYVNNYTCAVVYNSCGSYTYTNEASFVTADQGETGSDACTVAVEVPCEGGCTLTQGYWKTHSEFGPAPYDNTWAQLSNGASTIFFLSGKTYYQVLWTPPQGNAYYNLAHQYIAALLNQLNGASVPAAVLTAFNSATTVFSTYTPAQVGALKGAARNNILNLATILDNYNNGFTGPGHCSEESDSGSKPIESSSRSANQPESENLDVFPNPATESVQIDLSGALGGPADLAVYNQLGTVVWKKSFQEVTNAVFILPLSSGPFSSGVYYVVLNSGHRRLTQILVVHIDK